MFEWLRRRREAAGRDAEDAEGLRKRNDLAELPADIDPIEELVRILGDSHASDLRPDNDAGAFCRRARPKPALCNNRHYVKKRGHVVHSPSCGREHLRREAICRDDRRQLFRASQREQAPRHHGVERWE